MNNEYISVKIKSYVKNKLDLAKKRFTYSDYIEQMLEYFELTGVDPKLGQVPPVQTFVKAVNEGNSILYKRIEDIIKIIRNIETNKIDVILHGNTVNQSPSPEDVIGIEEEKVVQLINLNQDLAEELKAKDSTIEQLQRKISVLSKSSNSQEVIDTIEELLSDDALERDKKGNYIMSPDYKTQLIRKIKTIANVQ